MSDRYLADFITSINCDKRLFIAKMTEPAIVDQRLIRFSNTNHLDIDVIHALLNSIVSLFFLEANGFGRGLGALDLSSSRIHDCFKILNPLSLTTEQQTIIKEKFEPLTNEQIIDLHSELEKDIRIEFDRAILNIYGIEHLYENIKNSLLFLYDMRTKV